MVTNRTGSDLLAVTCEEENRLVAQDDVKTQELNDALSMLQEIFPQIEINTLRTLTVIGHHESLLQIAADRVLHRLSTGLSVNNVLPNIVSTSNVLDPETVDRFRSDTYKSAVKHEFTSEFGILFHNKIIEILEQNNYSYTKCRPLLMEAAAHSWRSAISNFLMRRKRHNNPYVLENHPLIIWNSDPFKTTVKWTSSPDLNRELWQTLIVPLRSQARLNQLKNDYSVSLRIAMEQATEEGEIYECKCCFGETIFEHLVACDSENHFICTGCVQRAACELVHGQNWHTGFDHARGTIHCFAVCGNRKCDGCIPLGQFENCLAKSEQFVKVLHQIHARLAMEALQKLMIPILQCPFCSYIEIDQIKLTCNSLIQMLFLRFQLDKAIYPRINHPALLSISLFSITCLLYELSQAGLAKPILLGITFLITLSTLCCRIIGRIRFGTRIELMESFNAYSILKKAIFQVLRKRQGFKFKCKSSQCGVYSCFNCSKPWIDPHHCPHDTTDLTRVLEEAATSAITRICPNCNISFIKSDGCNRVTCACGYAICYVCRKKISMSEGYGHFCTHFREPDGPCTEGPRGQPCGKCELYHVESDDVAINKAKNTAYASWLSGPLNSKSTTVNQTSRWWEDNIMSLSLASWLNGSYGNRLLLLCCKVFRMFILENMINQVVQFTLK